MLESLQKNSVYLLALSKERTQNIFLSASQQKDAEKIHDFSEQDWLLDKKEYKESLLKRHAMAQSALSKYESDNALYFLLEGDRESSNGVHYLQEHLTVCQGIFYSFISISQLLQAKKQHSEVLKKIVDAAVFTRDLSISQQTTPPAGEAQQAASGTGTATAPTAKSDGSTADNSLRRGLVKGLGAAFIILTICIFRYFLRAALKPQEDLTDTEAGTDRTEEVKTLPHQQLDTKQLKLLKILEELYQSGTITEEEFAEKKAKLLEKT